MDCPPSEATERGAWSVHTTATSTGSQRSPLRVDGMLTAPKLEQSRSATGRSPWRGQRDDGRTLRSASRARRLICDGARAPRADVASIRAAHSGCRKSIRRSIQGMLTRSEEQR